MFTMKIGGTMTKTKTVGCLDHFNPSYMIKLASLNGEPINVVEEKLTSFRGPI
jgi:hypothetical protein